MNRQTRSVTVRPWNANIVEDQKYDAFIGAVGYETRAIHVASTLAHRVETLYACAFDERKVFSYSKNYEWFREQGAAIDETTDSNYRVWCDQVLRKIITPSVEKKKICVDISSMSRFRIAALASAVFESDFSKLLSVDFLYAPAEFSPPGADQGPIVIAKPVLETFAGWTDEPDNPPVVILGLGYERDRAVGIVEYIEPGEVWAFIPRGEDVRYDSELNKANKTFFEVLPRDHAVKYFVDRPFECFTNLESMVYGILRHGRPILIPFGPKIFSVCCLLLSLSYYPKVAVWRVSSGQFEVPLDKVPNGKIVGLNAEFTPDVLENGLRLK